MGKFKKVTATVLSAVMALSVMSFTAFAEERKVAKIGKTEYDTLAKAVESAEDGDTIKLISDTLENIVIAKGQDITIDLNGYTLSGGTDKNEDGENTANKDKPAILNNGTLTIKDSDGDGMIKRDDDGVGSDSYYVIDNQGTMTIKGGTIYNNSGIKENGRTSGSSLIRNGGVVKGNEQGYAVLNIEGGKLQQDNFIAIKNDDYGELNITGGTIISKNESAVQNWSQADLTGGKIEGLIWTLVWEDDFGNSETKLGGDIKVEGIIRTGVEGNVTTVPEVTVDGGKYDVEWDISDELSEYVNVINGSFSQKVPEELLDEDSHLVKDEDGNYVAMDEETYEDYLDDNKSHGSRYELEEKENNRKDDDDEDKEEDKKPEEKPEEPKEESIFSDVAIDDPNYDAIVKVFEKGWMVGVSEKVFAPNGTLTRGMAATILWNKAGKPESVNAAPFLDVTADAWYAKAVAWAYEQGIVLGYDAETFGPNDFVTTEQFTIMLDKSEGKTPAPYAGGASNATRAWVASEIA